MCACRRSSQGSWSTTRPVRAPRSQTGCSSWSSCCPSWGSASESSTSASASRPCTGTARPTCGGRATHSRRRWRGRPSQTGRRSSAHSRPTSCRPTMQRRPRPSCCVCACAAARAWTHTCSGQRFSWRAQMGVCRMWRRRDPRWTASTARVSHLRWRQRARRCARLHFPCRSMSCAPSSRRWPWTSRRWVGALAGSQDRAGGQERHPAAQARRHPAADTGRRQQAKEATRPAR